MRRAPMHQMVGRHLGRRGGVSDRRAKAGAHRGVGWQANAVDAHAHRGWPTAPRMQACSASLTLAVARADRERRAGACAGRMLAPLFAPVVSGRVSRPLPHSCPGLCWLLRRASSGEVLWRASIRGVGKRWRSPKSADPNSAPTSLISFHLDEDPVTLAPLDAQIRLCGVTYCRLRRCPPKPSCRRPHLAKLSGDPSPDFRPIFRADSSRTPI